MAARGYQKTFKLSLSGGNDPNAKYTYNLGNFNNQLNKKMIITRVRFTYEYPYVIQTNAPVDNGKFPYYWYYAFTTVDSSEGILPSDTNSIIFGNVLPVVAFYNGLRQTNQYAFPDYDLSFDNDQKIVDGDLIFTAFQSGADLEYIQYIYLTLNWDYQAVSLMDLIKSKIR